jgi:hypothetical protein
MKMPAILIGFGVMLMLSPLSVHAGSPDKTKPDPCALLKPDDLTKLLGATPIAKSIRGGDGCSWTASGSKREFNAIIDKLTGPDAETVFMFGRTFAMNAAKSGGLTVTDEAGLGDKAFSSMDFSGVVLKIIKHGRLLDLQYYPNGPFTKGTTAKDLDALRPVAKKVVEAF